ncbi:MAG: TonB-dependent receptor [Thermoanaerobaculia bacterium]
MLTKSNWWSVGFAAALIALVAVFAVAPASAQEQVGAIIGSVSDASGAVLPGATVEAVSSGGARLSATTNESGAYRFPRVSPGTYVVVAKLDGFNPAEVQNVSVSLGQTVTANIALEVGAVSETISVVGDAGQIDIKGSATASSISAEDIQYLPKGRDFTSIATQAAGVNQEGFLGGLSVDGASGSENRFVIDGTDTTDAFDGTSGQNLVTDFVEEIQVKSAGYQAEYGGSVGGVVSAVTKSGTNEFKGSVGAQYGSRSWDGKEHPSPVRTSDTDLYETFKEDKITRTEPSFTLGGPILPDKAWFFVGYDTLATKTERTPPGRQTRESTTTRDYYSGNIKGNVGSEFLFKVAGNWAPSKVDNQLPSRTGSTPDSVSLNIDDKFPIASYSAYADFIPTDNFYLSGRAGFYTQDQQTSGDVASEVIFFRNTPFPIAGDPRFHEAGFATSPTTSLSGTAQDLFERSAASLDGNIFFDGLGTHALKAGMQYEKVENNVDSGEQGNLYTIRWGLPDRFGAGVQGTYGSLGVRRFATQGAAASKSLGFYLQDSWAVVPNLTLNLGLRTEKEEVPNFGHGTHPELQKNAWEFGYGDKLAPRLGFAWDVNGDQKLKVYGSWGLYYDISKLNIRGSFGGDQWIEYLFPLETLDWATVSAGCHRSTNSAGDNPCPGLGSPEATLDLRFPADPADPLFGVDPDLKPFEQEEWQVGADYQLNSTSVVTFRYVDKNVKHAIEDLGFFACDAPDNCFEGYNIGNPGEGLSSIDVPGPVPAQPKAKRTYRAVELGWNRRFAGNWSAHVGYTYSELRGNYPGLASSDEFGRTSPNTNRLFDYIHNSFDQNGKAVYGPLNTDRPHQIDAQFIYHFNFGTYVSVNQYYGSGTPISTQVSYAGVPFFPFGRNDAGRTSALTQTDLAITHPFKIGNFVLEANLNVLNLFDEDTVLLVDPLLSNGDLCDAAPGCDRSQTYFFSNAPFDTRALLDPASNNPYYGKANVSGSTTDAYQTRRTIRVGLTFRF